MIGLRSKSGSCLRSVKFPCDVDRISTIQLLLWEGSKFATVVEYFYPSTSVSFKINLEVSGGLQACGKFPCDVDRISTIQLLLWEDLKFATVVEYLYPSTSFKINVEVSGGLQACGDLS